MKPESVLLREIREDVDALTTNMGCRERGDANRIMCDLVYKLGLLHNYISKPQKKQTLRIVAKNEENV